MLPTIPVMPPGQKPVSKLASVAEQLTAAKAIAAYELAPWLKAHPKADLSLTFSDPVIKPTQGNLIRSSFGYKNPIPVLDAQVLTLVFDLPTRVAPKRISMETYVFLGSFPKGFRARYLVRMDGKVARVLSRTMLEWYEVEPVKKTNT